MSGTWRVFAAESLRALRQRSGFFAATILVAVSFAATGAVHYAARARHGAAVRRALLEGSDPPLAPAPENAYGPWLDGWAAGATLGTLLLVVVAARTLAGDVESGLARQALARGASRTAQVLGRAALGLVLVPLVVLLTGAGALAAAAAFFPFGDLTIDGTLVLREAEMRAVLPLVLATLLPPLYAAWCFGLFVSSLARGAAGAVIGALLPFLAFDLFKETLGSAREWVFASFAPTLVDRSFLRESAGVVRGFFDKGYAPELVDANFTVPLPQALFFLFVAALCYARRPL